jgi:hypothetical protein
VAFTTLSGATLTTLSGILKEYYLPPVIEQINNDVLLLQRLDTSTQEIFGKYVVVPVHTGRTGSIGARAEGAPLPDAGNQSYTNAHYDLTGLYGTVRATGLSMVKTSSDAGSFLQSLKSELDFIRNDLRKDLARQIYGTGDGVITTCGTTTASAVVVLSGTGFNEAINKGQLYVGMLVDIGVVANQQSIAQGRSITAITPATPSITISGAVVTTSSSNFVFRAGAVGQTVTAEINGLQNAVPTAANVFGTIDATVAAGAFWDVLRDTTSANLSMDKLMQAFNRVRQAGGQTSLVITSLGVQRGYFDLFTQTTKFTDPLNLAGGFEALTFMGKPVVADIDAPYGKVYLLDERYLKVFSNDDWHFLDEDGQTLHRNLGYDAYEATLARYMQFGLTRRNVQFVMTAVQVNSAADPGF